MEVRFPFMIYVLKFGAAWILPPGIFILALTAIAVYLWRRQVKAAAGILAAIAAVFYLLTTGAVADLFMGSLERTYPVPEHPQGDVIIMLGGGAIGGVQDVDGEGMLAPSPASRLLTAVRLHRLYGLPILLSGGQVFKDTGTEAEIARRVLISLGVPEEQIYTESESLTTGQNARYSAEILHREGFMHPILVTSAFHLPRAVLNFEKLGIEVTPYPSDFWVPAHPHLNPLKFVPSVSPFQTNITFLREELRTFVTRYLE
ncbi:hypothetical protein HMPREF9162_2126 [Selenomonas sp. oral taxon 137 str. F0430]|nr:hypothetical protein HMPREF9162_2126 [Selenomonas sp. oral taxon 137 str. F0430]